MASNRDDNLKESIDDLVKGIGAMNAHNVAMLAAQEKNTKATEEAGTGRGGRKSLLQAAKAIPYVGSVIVKGHAMLNQTLQMNNKFQQEAQARGRNLGDYTNILKESTTSMTDGMAGYGDLLNATVGQFNAGLRDNVEATRALGVYTQLTGGDQKKIFKGMRSLTMATGTSVIEQESLSNHIIGLSKQFGLSSNEIASSMSGLGKNLSLLKDMNIAPEMAKATASLTAALGGTGMEATAKEFVDALMGPGGDTLAGIAGIGETRRKLELGEGNSSELILKAFVKVGGELNRLGDEAKAAGVGVERTTTMYRNQYKGLMVSKSGMHEFQKQVDRTGLSLDEFIKKASSPSSNGNNDPINTWTGLWGRVFSPLVEATTAIQDAFYEFTAAFPKISTWVGRGLIAAAVVAAVVFRKGLLSGAGGLFGKLLGGIGMGAGAGLTGLAGGLTALAPALAAIAFPLAGVAIAFGIFSVALIGVAYAFNESMKGFETFGQVISRLVKEPLSNLNGLGGNLMAIAAGMTAVSIAQGLMGLGSAVVSLFSGEDPMDRRRKALEQGTEVRHKVSLEKWNESLENQRMQILILETMNENLGVANTQRVSIQSTVRPSELRKK